MHRISVLIVAALMFAFGCGDGTAGDPSAPTSAAAPEPQYLLFQVMTFAPQVRGTGFESPATIASKSNTESQVREIVTAIGERGDQDSRQLGFAVGPLAFDMTDGELRSVIQYSFAIAETHDVAVAFHIDDSMFWNRRTDLHASIENVEWSDWNRTPVPHRIIGWAGNGAPFLAPPMCYTSPAIIEETTRIARDVIGVEIKTGLDHLISIGKPHLFAGVIAGWETRMQDDSAIAGAPVYYGYCALHHLGYSASKPPADFDEALQDVVKDWITLWANGLTAAGLSKERVYTHIGSPAEAPANFPFNIARDFYKNSDPKVTAFNDYSRPGFSVYGGPFEPLHELLAARQPVPWGIAEGTAITLGDAFSGGTYTPSGEMERYLAGAFNHGAAYVNLFGWSTSLRDSFAQATAGADAVAAYQKFLRGDVLSE